MGTHSHSRHARRRGRKSAWGLAVASIAMILLAVVAVFVPASGKPKYVVSQRFIPGGLLIHPKTYPTPSPSAKADPRPSLGPFPYPTYRIPTYPAPVYPAPIYPTYPTPSRTYPAPHRTYPAPHSPSPSPNNDLPPVLPLIQPMLGVVSNDPAAWGNAVHKQPVLATRYVSMSTPLSPSWLHSAMRVADGATPVIEILPDNISLSQVAAGQGDKWLQDLRTEIDRLGRPVIIGFAPEANGRWYSWGEDPVNFKVAYIHVYNTIGTNLVTWMWQVSAHNQGDPATQDFNAYWPGSKYVNWVGFDGYYYQPGDSFELRFGFSLREVESWWHGPIIIGETAVSPLTRNMPNDITDLFNSVVSNHLLGLIYLDLNVCQGLCSIYKQDFRVEQYPSALAAFLQAAAKW